MRRHCKKVSMFFFKFTITYFRFSTPETKDENIPWKNKQKYIQLKKLTAWKVLSCALTACDRDDGSVSTITWLLSRSVNRHSRLEPWINRQIRDSKKKILFANIEIRLFTISQNENNMVHFQGVKVCDRDDSNVRK